jgi:hypothetical protein
MGQARVSSSRRGAHNTFRAKTTISQNLWYDGRHEFAVAPFRLVGVVGSRFSTCAGCSRPERMGRQPAEPALDCGSLLPLCGGRSLLRAARVCPLLRAARSRAAASAKRQQAAAVQDRSASRSVLLWNTPASTFARRAQRYILSRNPSTNSAPRFGSRFPKFPKLAPRIPHSRLVEHNSRKPVPYRKTLHFVPKLARHFRQSFPKVERRLCFTLQAIPTIPENSACRSFAALLWNIPHSTPLHGAKRYISSRNPLAMLKACSTAPDFRNSMNPEMPARRSRERFRGTRPSIALSRDC